MSLIVCITDTHSGVRGDSVVFMDNMKQFYLECFFPYIKKNNIKHLIHLGDMFDKRKATNTYAAERLRTDFLEPLDDLNIRSDFIVGNHDSHFKNVLTTNTQREIIHGKYENMNIVDSPRVVKSLDKKSDIIMVPWICKDNYEETMELIKNTKVKICFGHLELVGFEMHKGQVMTTGMDPSIFKKFDVVASGHYHKRSKKGNVQYLGAAGEYTWHDYNCPRGFNVFDTDTKKFTFIQNPFHMFCKLVYEEDEMPKDLTEYNGKMVRLEVPGKVNQLKLENFISELEDVGPADLQIAENRASIEEGIEVGIDVEDTKTVIKNYVGAMNDVDVPSLEKLMINLYDEALQVE